MPLRNRNSVLLFKIESTPGVDASPVGSTDAIQVNGSPNFSFNPNLIQTDEVNGSLDGAGPIVGGMQAQISFDVYFKGAGAAGTAPEWGKLLRACGWAETITATAIPASAEACAAGGSTTTAVLGTSASTTAQLYRGMPINFSGTVSGSSFISDYTAGKVATLTDIMGGTIVATTSYQIPVNVLYSPASASIPSATIYFYNDGLLHKMVGCVGTFQLKASANGVGIISFTFSGLFAGKTDAALPSATYDSTRAPVFINGKAYYNRLAAALESLALDNGITIAYPDDPNQTEGYQPPLHTTRRMTGSINPMETLVATRDAVSDFRAGTRRILHARWGSVAGNRLAVTIPAAQATNVTRGDRSGMTTTDIPFECVGRDAGSFICLY